MIKQFFCCLLSTLVFLNSLQLSASTTARKDDDNDVLLRSRSSQTTDILNPPASLRRTQTNFFSESRRATTVAQDAAFIAAEAYRNRMSAPATGRENADYQHRTPLFLRNIESAEDHYARLDNANRCLSLMEAVSSRVLSNIFLGSAVLLTIGATGFKTFYDHQNGTNIGEILFFVSGGATTIGTMLKQISDTKSSAITQMREKMHTAAATQAAEEIAELQANHDRTKQKLRTLKAQSGGTPLAARAQSASLSAVALNRRLRAVTDVYPDVDGTPPQKRTKKPKRHSTKPRIQESASTSTADTSASEGTTESSGSTQGRTTISVAAVS